MKPHRFSLEPLNFPTMPASDLVSVAAQASFEFVSFTLNTPAAKVLPVSEVVADRSRRSALKAQMRETGVGLLNIECFNLTPESKVEEFRAGLECGHDLGARSGTAILWENSNRADGLAKYRALCDMAAELGISINLEFFGTCKSMNKLGDALAFVKEAARPNGGLVIDIMHVIRNGSSVEDLRKLDPKLIKMVQLCDGPKSVPPDFAVAEVTANRLYPGEGTFPVRDFVRALPSDAVVGLECPKETLSGKVSPVEQARNMLAAARAVYA